MSKGDFLIQVLNLVYHQFHFHVVVFVLVIVVVQGVEDVEVYKLEVDY